MGFKLEDYKMVYVRRDEFREKYPDGRIITEVVNQTDKSVTFKASIYRNYKETEPFATGHAEEYRSESGTGKKWINEGNHLENCETSAVGRALENAGFSKGGDQIPSFTETAREMIKNGSAKTTSKTNSDDEDILEALSTESNNATGQKPTSKQKNYLVALVKDTKVQREIDEKQLNADMIKDLGFGLMEASKDFDKISRAIEWVKGGLSD